MFSVWVLFRLDTGLISFGVTGVGRGTVDQKLSMGSLPCPALPALLQAVPAGPLAFQPLTKLVDVASQHNWQMGTLQGSLPHHAETPCIQPAYG